MYLLMLILNSRSIFTSISAPIPGIDFLGRPSFLSLAIRLLPLAPEF